MSLELFFYGFRRNLTLLDFKSLDIAEQITLIDLNLFAKIEVFFFLLKKKTLFYLN
jgi:hypothetical protein